MTVADSGGSQATVVGSATVSPPPMPNEQFVTAAFQDVLARSVDAASLAFWAQQIAQGMPRSGVAAAIDHSAE